MRIDLGSISEEQAHDVRSAGAGGVEEGSPALCISTIEIGPSTYETFHIREISALNGPDEFCVRRGHGFEA
jgi:hypothetical protein